MFLYEQMGTEKKSENCRKSLLYFEWQFSPIYRIKDLNTWLSGIGTIWKD